MFYCYMTLGVTQLSPRPLSEWLTVLNFLWPSSALLFLVPSPAGFKTTLTSENLQTSIIPGVLIRRVRCRLSERILEWAVNVLIILKCVLVLLATAAAFSCPVWTQALTWEAELVSLEYELASLSCVSLNLSCSACMKFCAPASASEMALSVLSRKLCIHDWAWVAMSWRSFLALSVLVSAAANWNHRQGTIIYVHEDSPVTQVILYRMIEVIIWGPNSEFF
jgi:hypothetical protein